MRGEHAVVIGGSIGGLLAARVLADAYERVTVIEREALPVGNEGRKAVPQGRHVHALTPRGLQAMEGLLPGLHDEMVEDGAASLGLGIDVHISVSGHEFARTALGVDEILASRPFIEGHIRRRVRGLPGIELREGCEATGLLADADDARVAGVRLAVDGAEELIEADLVVAATGRSARIPAWLEELGYERPRESLLVVDMGYATRDYRLRPGSLGGDKLIMVTPPPEAPRGIFLLEQEGGVWRLTLLGYGDSAPPGDEAGFEAFLEEVAPADVSVALRDAEPLGEIVTNRFHASRRRRYERLRPFPAGLLPIGDAICSFNPIYGQGMTVAALEAAALRRCLGDESDHLQRRYLRAAARIVDDAWRAATSSDLALPVVEGKRSLQVRVLNAYVERLKVVAERDARAASALTRVAMMLERPTYFLRPAVVRRVLGRPDPYIWPGRPLRTSIRRRTMRVDGIATPLREAGPAEASEAVVFVHGNPGSGADFEPLLAAAGQVGRTVAWDAPGFGRADKPEGFEQSIDGHARFIGRALEELGIERAHLVLHDFGGPWGLAWAANEPERLASATLLGTGALLDYRWHRMARIWRTHRVGEAAMRLTSRRTFRAALKPGNPRGLPGPFVDRMHADFDRRTREAVLRLYRSVEDIAGEGRRLASALRPLDRPALVIWGKRDPYLPVKLAERQREVFPGAEVHVLEQSGHWPFVDQADRVEELLVGFLERTLAGTAEREGEAQPA